ncbi:33302_t:CDS:2, partial [Racocetra persica]
EYNIFVKVINALRELERKYTEELEKILRKKKENQKKYHDKLNKFLEIKDSLTYITIEHLSKEKEVLKKGLDLENLHIKDYLQFYTPAFFTALSRVYDYYKSGKVGEYFRNQSKKIQANYLNKLIYKPKEYFDNKKKRKENRFKKNEFTIVHLKNMKCYNCRRKRHLMSD